MRVGSARYAAHTTVHYGRLALTVSVCRAVTLSQRKMQHALHDTECSYREQTQGRLVHIAQFFVSRASLAFIPSVHL